jgi:hypothetical protein
MEIKAFDRHNVNKILDPEFLEALIPVAEKYGLKVRSKGGSFTPYKWTGKFEFLAPEGAVESDNKIGKQLGAKFEVGFEWTSGGKTFRVTGFNPKRPKNDTEVLRLHDGAELKCSHDLPNRYVTSK